MFAIKLNVVKSIYALVSSTSFGDGMSGGTYILPWYSLH